MGWLSTQMLMPDSMGSSSSCSANYKMSVIWDKLPNLSCKGCDKSIPKGCWEHTFS